MTAELDYGQLWAGTAPAARRYAATLVPAHDAEDVVSEAFARVISATQRGRGPSGEFRPYVMAAVRNQAYDERGRHRRLVPVPDAGHQVPVPGPEDHAERREDARLALGAFRTLPPRWQWVLWQTAVEERTPAELAEQTGMSANTVAQLSSRAREGLRQAYLTANLGSAMPAGCAAVAPYMGAAVRGRAGHRHQAQLSLHLRRCERCAAAYDGLGMLNTRLAELLVPGAVAGGLLSRLLPAARLAGRGMAHGSRMTPLAVSGTALALGGLVVVGTVSIHPAAPVVHVVPVAAVPAAPGPGPRAPRHARPAAPASPAAPAPSGPAAASSGPSGPGSVPAPAICPVQPAVSAVASIAGAVTGPVAGAVTGAVTGVVGRVLPPSGLSGQLARLGRGTGGLPGGL